MSVRVIIGDALTELRKMPDESVHCCITSPPYFGLRDYGCGGQIGLEPSPREYIAALVAVFREVRRTLRNDGTLWLNIGDSYSAHAGQRKTTDIAGIKQQSNVASVNAPSRCAEGCKPKDLIGIPWLLAFALRNDGWWLRQDIIWSKPNPMPESVTDRPTKAHEYLFLLAKSERYYYAAEAIREAGSTNSHGGTPNQGGPKQETIGQNRGGHLGIPARGRDRGRPNGAPTFEKSCGTPQDQLRNRRSVWEVATQPFPEAHFATFPPALIEPCILAGCPRGGTILDPFGGAGTTGLVADRLGRDAILIELNPDYAKMARRRIAGDGGMFAAVEITTPLQPTFAGKSTSKGQ